MESTITNHVGAGRWVRRVLIIGGVWLAWTKPAWANQPPGPHMLLSEVLILPLMMLLTVLGGGYALMRAKGVKHTRWAVVAAVVAIFLTGINEGFSAMLMLIFGPYALVRGVRLILWGVGALRPPEKRAVHLAHASPGRLIGAGSLTCLATVALVGMNFAFVGWWPGEGFVEKGLKRMVASTLVEGNERKDASGSSLYQPPEIGILRRNFHDEFKLAPGGKSFQLWVWPDRMPFFPYNYLVTLPSFYADQTGQIRMIRVHKNGQRCPPDAPVYYRVRPEDAQPSP